MALFSGLQGSFQMEAFHPTKKRGQTGEANRETYLGEQKVRRSWAVKL